MEEEIEGIVRKPKIRGFFAISFVFMYFEG